MATELQVVEALLERALPDPRGFAERVVQQAVDRLTAAEPPGAGDHQADALAAAEGLADRNLILAAALGACECWGAIPDCPVCGGRGAPGWTEPDAELFSEFVEPAMARTAKPAAPDKV